MFLGGDTVPSTTFFNLPEEKRERLLKAAKDEFSRVPLGEASINRIVKAAGIPRGSFYMYFRDKLDLACYVMDNHVNRAIDFYKETLREENGDVFKAYFRMIDVLLDECVSAENLSMFRNFAAYFLNNLSEPFVLPPPSARMDGLSEEFSGLANFNLKDRQHLRDCADVLIAVTRDEFAGLMIGRKNVREVRSSLKRKVEILKNGMLGEKDR